jgi:hypothetical protein
LAVVRWVYCVRFGLHWLRVRRSHYEERAPGPQLCAELTVSGKPGVAVAFDVWESRFNGLHGYNLTTICARSKLLILYGGESGGFHDDTPHYGNLGSKIDQK